MVLTAYANKTDVQRVVDGMRDVLGGGFSNVMIVRPVFNKKGFSSWCQLEICCESVCS